MVLTPEQRFLTSQSGLITRSQALGCGFSASAITRRVAAREWRPVLPGVYRHVAVAVSDLLMVHAAMLWVGASGTLSGAWAAWWHGSRTEPVGPVSVTVPLTSGLRSHGDVMLRRRTLSDGDVVVIRGVRVVTRELAALENAALPDGQDVVDRALQRHVSVAALARTMERFSGAAGAAAARRSVELARSGAVSPPERELAAALRKAGLTEIVAGVKVEIDGQLMWLDFAAVRVRLAIEVDGVAPHSDPSRFHSDRQRQNRLVRAGWTVLRYTPWQLRTGMDQAVGEIAQTLADCVR